MPFWADARPGRQTISEFPSMGLFRPRRVESWLFSAGPVEQNLEA